MLATLLAVAAIAVDHPRVGSRSTSCARIHFRLGVGVVGTTPRPVGARSREHPVSPPGRPCSLGLNRRRRLSPAPVAQCSASLLARRPRRHLLCPPPASRLAARAGIDRRVRLHFLHGGSGALIPGTGGARGLWRYAPLIAHTLRLRPGAQALCQPVDADRLAGPARCDEIKAQTGSFRDRDRASVRGLNTGDDARGVQRRWRLVADSDGTLAS